MPRIRKMCADGFFDDIGKETKHATDNIKALGDGLHVRMSVAQRRTLKKGGKITIKPEMLHEMGEFVPMASQLVKKAMSAMKKGKGIRISAYQSPTGIPTNAESLLGEASPQPQMGGKGYRFGDFLNDIKPVTDFIRPIAEAGRDRVINKIKGMGTKKGMERKTSRLAYEPDYAMYKKMRGKGYRFEDFLNDIKPVTDFVRPIAEVGRDKVINKIKGMGKLTITHGEGLSTGGSFLTAGAMGGAMSTAITAQNSGAIQLGSPYQHPGSQAMSPFVPATSQLSGTNRLSTHKSSRIYRK